jgi:hypothetical protein
MRLLLGSLLLAVWFLSAETAPLAAQPVEAPKPPEAKKEEPPNQVMHYTLAAIGTMIVMVVVCMPARRD